MDGPAAVAPRLGWWWQRSESYRGCLWCL